MTVDHTIQVRINGEHRRVDNGITIAEMVREIAARVAHLLCETATRTGIDVGSQAMVNPFTQQQIAEITGQTSVNVNRVMADLERQGLIERSGRDIRFTDWPEMRRVASFQPAYLE